MQRNFIIIRQEIYANGFSKVVAVLLNGFPYFVTPQYPPPIMPKTTNVVATAAPAAIPTLIGFAG